MRPIRPLLPLLLGLTAGLPAGAQGIFKNANSPTDPICPRVLQDKTALNFGAASPSTTGGQVGADSTHRLHYQQGSQFIPAEARRSVAAFAAYDEQARGTGLASLKGKVVLVGLWSVRCDPSARMLMELASLYPKREAFGFEVLAVNFDENQQDGGRIEGGWRAIHSFRTRNRAFFGATAMPLFVPGLGKEGPATFMDMVHSLPVLFVVDREGRLAQVHIGYKDGFVGEALRIALRERPPAPPGPAAPAPPPAGQP